jgi:hypothetical protein
MNLIVNEPGIRNKISAKNYDVEFVIIRRYYIIFVPAMDPVVFLAPAKKFINPLE